MFQELILFFSVLSFPIQLGYHFWPTFAYVSGFRIDYLSPTIYLSDLILFLYILINYRILKQLLIKNKVYLLPLSVLVILNFLFSISPLNTLSWFIHLILYSLYALTIRAKKISLDKILKPLLVMSLLIIVVEVIQIIYQGSLGGLLYWLGERSMSISTPNSAKIVILGRMYLRPYSIFSHPNSLAGYLFVVLILTMLTKRYKPYWAIISFGIILTLSKSTIIALVLLFSSIPATYILLTTLLGTILPLIDTGTIMKFLPKFIRSRLFYIQNTKLIIQKFPFFGVGYGNYITALEKVLPLKDYGFANFQPVHNVFLLIISEFGLINSLVVSLYFFLHKKISYLKSENFRLISLILFLCAFDHYFYTLPQNKIILMIALVYLV